MTIENSSRIIEENPEDQSFPPFPSDMRAQGWRLELSYDLLETSDTWALLEPEIKPWLLMLLFKAWQQSPIGSFPNDSKIIANKLGMSYPLFLQHQNILMRGWKLYQDNRLYHPVLIQTVERMLLKNQSNAKKQKAHRDRLKSSVTVTLPLRNRNVTVTNRLVTTLEQELEQEQEANLNICSCETVIPVNVSSSLEEDRPTTLGDVLENNKEKVLEEKERESLQSKLSSRAQARACARNVEQQNQIEIEGCEPVTQGGNGKAKATLEQRSTQVSSEIQEVFEHWKRVMGHPRAILDDKRKRLIGNWRKIGYTVEQLKLAIEGCSKSAFHMGENDRNKRFDSIELILRDGAHIDGFIRDAAKPELIHQSEVHLSKAGLATQRAGERWLEKMRKERELEVQQGVGTLQ